MRALLVLLAAVLVGCSPAPAPAPPVPAAAPDTAGWTGSWATAATVPGDDGLAADGFSGTTLRQVVQLSLGGPTLRLRLTNAFGTTPLFVAATTLGLAAGGPTVAATFGGSGVVTVPAGEEIASDPVPLPAPDGADVLVTTALPGPTGPATQHPGAAATTYAGTGDGFRPVSTSWYFLAGIDVPAPGTAGAVVALGDSITDGVGSTAGADRRYPDALAARLRAAGLRLGVLNAGIGGNEVLADRGTAGEALGERLERDVLDEPGVRTVVLVEGINDIARSRGAVDPDALTDAYTAVAARLHERGVRLVLGTLTPYGGAAVATPEGEAVRQAVNTWIRGSTVADAVVDLDAAVRDPADPTRLASAYDSGDGLHPGDAGYAAMAAAVDLATL
ncbi:SGNH/GDSL hydrolase family protein [Rhodococcus aerolatus]